MNSSRQECKGSGRIASPIVVRNNSLKCPHCHQQVNVVPKRRPDLQGYRMIIESHNDERLSSNPWIAS